MSVWGEALGRVLHRWRRRRLLARLRQHTMPRAVLFICHGNLCRSPYAAAVFRARLGLTSAAIEVRSAGFAGSGRPAPRFAVEEAAARGIDLRSHRSTTVSAVELRGAELVVVMDPEQARALRQRFRSLGTVVILADLDPAGHGDRVIADPIERPRSAFAASYDRIDRCVAEFASELAGRSHHA